MIQTFLLHAFHPTILFIHSIYSFHLIHSDVLDPLDNLFIVIFTLCIIHLNESIRALSPSIIYDTRISKKKSRQYHFQSILSFTHLTGVFYDDCKPTRSLQIRLKVALYPKKVEEKSKDPRRSDALSCVDVLVLSGVSEEIVLILRL